jgi:hypothetical protein
MPTNSLKSSWVQSRTFRRAVAFVMAFGITALAALWFRNAGGVLLGVITAMMFSFADEQGPLIRRFTALGRAAAGIALGGAVGYLLAGYGPVFWVLFVAGAFIAAWLNRAGKSAHIGARLGVIALTISAGTHAMSSHEVWFVVIALIAVALVRLADHAIFGPLPQSSSPPPQATSEGNGFWLRFAIAYAAAATFGLWLGLKLDPHHAIWVVVTTLVVMQPDDRRNYRRIFEGVIGTLLGVAVAFMLTTFVHAEPLTFLALIATAAALPHHLPARFWLHMAGIALMVMLAYDLASQVSGVAMDIHRGLFGERVIDVLVGCLMALVGTELGFHWGAKAKPAAD